MNNYVVYGGSFNPVTWAHIEVIGLLLGLPTVNKVFVVPVGDFYPKKELIPAIHRFNMLKHLEENKNVVISDIEINAPRQYRTYETLIELQKQNPNSKFSFVIGADNLVEIDKWAQADLLLKNFNLYVLERRGYDISNIINNSKFLTKYKSSIKSIHTDIGMGISSTLTRKLIKSKQLDNVLLEYIDNDTLSYIKKHNLYK